MITGNDPMTGEVTLRSKNPMMPNVRMTPQTTIPREESGSGRG
jgi:hypothetical protein